MVVVMVFFDSLGFTFNRLNTFLMFSVFWHIFDSIKASGCFWFGISQLSVMNSTTSTMKVKASSYLWLSWNQHLKLVCDLSSIYEIRCEIKSSDNVNGSNSLVKANEFFLYCCYSYLFVFLLWLLLHQLVS